MNRRLFTLLQKYDVAGPRYTSYPTAPAWTTDVGQEEYLRGLRGLRAGERLSLYFHIPFCENLCHFCGCMKVITKDHERSQGYVEILLKELSHVAGTIIPAAREVSQVHFGGGSPNFLKPQELKKLVDSVRSSFNLMPQAEIAIEMHPRTSKGEFCEEVARLGFNRISLGVQDFDPKVQKLINRHQTYEITAEMVSHLRKLGLRSFNFDLIYGLPGQSMEGWERTLGQVLALRPNRLAVYSYAHVPWLKPYQRSFEDKDLPSPGMKILLFEKAYETFTDNGYRLIGMDHFCLNDDDLSEAMDKGTIHRNFMGYSTQADTHQVGFGVSAISYVGGNYFQNEKELSPYEKAVHAGRLATFRGHLLSRDDAIRRDLIMRIMCRGCLEIADFEEKWGIDFGNYFRDDLSRLRTFLDDGLLQQNGRGLHVVGEGFLFLRNIAMVFDRYLEGIKERAVNPVFSRTV